MRLFIPLILLMASTAAAQWVKQEVGTDASFRGLSVVNAKIVWASGTKGTFIRTVDGGAHWQVGVVPGARLGSLVAVRSSERTALLRRRRFSFCLLRLIWLLMFATESPCSEKSIEVPHAPGRSGPWERAGG